jgi:hypothetical protein
MKGGANACEGMAPNVPPGIRSLPVAVLKVVLAVSNLAEHRFSGWKRTRLRQILASAAFDLV